MEERTFIHTLLHWLLVAAAVAITAYVLPGVTVTNFFTAFVAAVALGFINAFIRPILLVLTLPITVVTLGVFALFLNALLVLLASALVPGFAVAGFWWAVLFSIVLFLVNITLQTLGRPYPAEKTR